MSVSKIESELKKYLSKKVKFAFLFLQDLKEYFRRSSEVKLAVYFGRRITDEDIRDLKTKLEKYFLNKYNFDVIALDIAEVIDGIKLLVEGKLLLQDDIGEFHSYQAKIHSMYIDYKYSFEKNFKQPFEPFSARD